MSCNYFEKLILQAREFDDGIARLIGIWKLPHVLVGRFAECTAETSAHAEAVWNTIRSTQKGIDELLSAVTCSTSGNSVGIEQLLKESTEAYNELKEQCDNLDTVLAEYGYHYDINDSTAENTNTVEDEESDRETSIEKDNLEVEFTPNLSWKCKIRSSDPSTPTPSVHRASRTVVTPITQSSASSSKLNSSLIHKHYTTCTPVRERPQVPIYSKHYYNVLKK